MEFSSRQDAGRQLADYLLNLRVQADMVLGLPRGGVVVAAEVASALKAPLDVLLVRKIGHPRHREYAVGALAEGDVVHLDDLAIQRTHVREEELEGVIAEEKSRLEDYQQKFERSGPPELDGKTVLLVDDGIATGMTTEAAVLAARQKRAQQVFVAAPVTSGSAYERLKTVADQVFALLVDPEFDAVGRYYLEFDQTSDEEVMELLHARRHC